LVGLRAEHQALVALAAEAEEDAADLALYDERKAELAQDRAAALPPKISALMLRGMSLPRALRKWRGLTQQAVASKIGAAQGFVSDLESGGRRAAAKAVHALAALCDVPVERLLDAVGPRGRSD
jgi:predicted transcriptional regulator